MRLVPISAQTPVYLVESSEQREAGEQVHLCINGVRITNGNVNQTRPRHLYVVFLVGQLGSQRDLPSFLFMISNLSAAQSGGGAGTAPGRRRNSQISPQQGCSSHLQEFLVPRPLVYVVCKRTVGLTILSSHIWGLSLVDGNAKMFEEGI